MGGLIYQEKGKEDKGGDRRKREWEERCLYNCSFADSRVCPLNLLEMVNESRNDSS